MKYSNIVLATIILISVVMWSGCTKDLPCTFDRYLGTHTMVSDCRSSIQATITRGTDSNQLVFDDGSSKYLFEIDLSDPCIATYESDKFGFGLLLPSGEMQLSNDKIKVHITTYITLIPLTCNYTLELD